ncbi:MAG: hypothetical protein U0903_12755 [Planctomycetales bacterium]
MQPRLILPLLICALLTGCMQELEKQTEKTGSIIGKKTQDVGKFDPNAKQKVVDENRKVIDEKDVTAPVTGSIQMYGPMLEKISKTHIHYALELYRAENDRYPKTYEEFMEKIIKANNIELPVLPAKMKYKYDVENHKLVIVQDEADIPPEEKKK